MSDIGDRWSIISIGDRWCQVISDINRRSMLSGNHILGESKSVHIRHRRSVKSSDPIDRRWGFIGNVRGSHASDLRPQWPQVNTSQRIQWSQVIIYLLTAQWSQVITSDPRPQWYQAITYLTDQWSQMIRIITNIQSDQDNKHHTDQWWHQTEKSDLRW